MLCINMYIVGFLVCFNFQGLFEQKKKQPYLKEKLGLCSIYMYVLIIVTDMQRNRFFISKNCRIVV